MERIRNSIITTGKQIKRSGWLAWASVAVMTLAALVTTIFAFLALTSFLFLQSIEEQPQIYVFFEVGTSEEKIFDLQRQWEQLDGVAFVEYTSEAEAREEFLRAQENVNELAADAVRERNLPASLAIRLVSLDFAEGVNMAIEDVTENDPDIKDIRFSREIVENIREVFTWLRLGGGVIMTLLLVVIVLFTLLTVEFRMHSRSSEIEIMQLVGGSLAYIRMPFIIEGAIYGMLGGIISNVILAGMLGFVYYQLNTGQLNYIRELLGGLAWPTLDIPTLILGFTAVVLLAIILGALNSFIAIRRYIR